MTGSAHEAAQFGGEVHAGDPALTVAGAADQRDLICGSVILLWRSLGLFLSFKKCQRGRRIT